MSILFRLAVLIMIYVLPYSQVSFAQSAARDISADGLGAYKGSFTRADGFKINVSIDFTPYDAQGLGADMFVYIGESGACRLRLFLEANNAKVAEYSAKIFDEGQFCDGLNGVKLSKQADGTLSIALDGGRSSGELNTLPAELAVARKALRETLEDGIACERYGELSLPNLLACGVGSVAKRLGENPQFELKLFNPSIQGGRLVASAKAFTQMGIAINTLQDASPGKSDIVDNELIYAALASGIPSSFNIHCVFELKYADRISTDGGPVSFRASIQDLRGQDAVFECVPL